VLPRFGPPTSESGPVHAAVATCGAPYAVLGAQPMRVRRPCLLREALAATLPSRPEKWPGLRRCLACLLGSIPMPLALRCSVPLGLQLVPLPPHDRPLPLRARRALPTGGLALALSWPQRHCVGEGPLQAQLGFPGAAAVGLQSVQSYGQLESGALEVLLRSRSTLSAWCCDRCLPVCSAVSWSCSASTSFSRRLNSDRQNSRWCLSST
jgi:hypothetical protein